MRKHFKSRFPAFNLHRRSEEVATDTIFSDTPAIDSGVTMAQIFVGKRTLVTDVYPLKSQEQFVHTRDYAKVEISNKVKDILRMYHGSSWNSEHYHQKNQNPADGRYYTLKSWTNTTMNRTGAPADYWLLCMFHASYILKSPLLRGLGWPCSPRYAFWSFSRHQHHSTLHIQPTSVLSHPQSILPLCY